MARILFLSVWLAAQVSAHATMHGCNQLVIDFTNEKDAVAKATWSELERITISKDGLGWDGNPAHSRDCWFMTKPLAIGWSWRPTISAYIQADVQLPLDDYKLENGRVVTPMHGELYVRYSADHQHWSSWQALAVDEQVLKEKRKMVYKGVARVPYLAREEYGELVSEYSGLDVPWGSDEEAAVKWILSRQPKFFETSTPFVGYVQFLYEGGLLGNRRIAKFTADIRYGVGGMHQSPKDQSVYENRDGPWRFKAE